MPTQHFNHAGRLDIWLTRELGHCAPAPPPQAGGRTAYLGHLEAIKSNNKEMMT